MADSCAGREQDRERMRLLRECLALFEGVRPFHNFTKRRLYRASQRQQAGRRGKRKAGGHALPGACFTSSNNDWHQL